MFNFFKKKEEPFKVVACTDGKCIHISEVKDPVFGEKMMGDGFAIIPSSDTIVAPVSGSVEVVFPTGHAVGFKTSNGVEVLVHIGIDTVNLNGDGFKTLVKQGTKVKAGQPIVQIDSEKVKAAGYDLTTMTIFTAGYSTEVKLSCYNQDVKAGDTLID